MLIRTLLSLVLVLGGAAWLSAQTLQLPNFSFNTINTTVSVPDGGTVLLGGVKRAASGQTSRGVPIAGKIPGVGRLFNNRGIGQNMSAGTHSITARIIDFEEEEAKLGISGFGDGGLAGGPGLPEPARDPINDRADFLSRNVGRREASRPIEQTPAGPTAEQIAARNAAAADARQVEAHELYQKAQTAAAAGKLKVAKIYLDMAARRATGDLNDHVVAQQQVVVNALTVATADPVPGQR